MIYFTRHLFLFFFILTLAACQPKTRFDRLTASQTGIDFANTITETDSMNVLECEYIYNGGGVGVGGFNGDGFQDVFFAGNQVSSKLYLNKGNADNGPFSFTDTTQSAGVVTRNWCTGVAVEDINQDGRLDIYVSTIDPDRTKAVPNLLFMNMVDTPLPKGAGILGLPPQRVCMPSELTRYALPLYS